MKDDGFMKMIHTQLSPETELAIELRCREIWACEDVKQVKAFCIDMMKIMPELKQYYLRQ